MSMPMQLMSLLMSAPGLHGKDTPRPPANSCKQPSAVDISEPHAPLIGAFLNHLERERGNQARTRNWRPTAIHSLFGYATLRHPEHAASSAASWRSRPSATSTPSSAG